MAAVLLGSMIFGGLGNLLEPGERTTLITPPRDQIPNDAGYSVPVPEIDLSLFKEVQEETSAQRYTNEPKPYLHLLRAALKLVPGSLREMGLPDQPVPVAELQKNPDKFRGSPLFYEGELLSIRPPEKIPGLDGFEVTEGLIETKAKEKILFAIIEPLPEDIHRGSLVRIEGLFFKLRDENFPFKVKKAPYLIGVNLKRAFKEFPPVKTLDPKILGLVKDKSLRESKKIEDLPYYHLASWLMNQKDRKDWPKKIPELTREIAVHMAQADGTIPRGKMFKIMANLLWVQVIKAEPNPLKVAFWSRVWVYHPTIGTIALKIPGKLPMDWKTGDEVVVYGAFLKRIYYETGARKSEWKYRFRIIPFFVADQLYRLRIVDNPVNGILRIFFLGLTAFLILALMILAVRDSRADKEIRDRLRRKKIERMRNRRMGG
ncbi:MAG TPA: hypothetical protein ENK02_14275 [Planctomycetes bacterium]|nr:hypothetical protein [Planctomycetota bacterium]